MRRKKNVFVSYLILLCKVEIEISLLKKFKLGQTNSDFSCCGCNYLSPLIKIFLVVFTPADDVKKCRIIYDSRLRFFSGLFSMETGKMKGTYITLRYVSHMPHRVWKCSISMYIKLTAFHMTCGRELSALSFSQKKEFPGRKIARGDEILLEWKTILWAFHDASRYWKIYSVRAVMISSHSSRRTLIFFLSLSILDGNMTYKIVLTGAWTILWANGSKINNTSCPCIEYCSPRYLQQLFKYLNIQSSISVINHSLHPSSVWEWEIEKKTA